MSEAVTGSTVETGTSSQNPAAGAAVYPEKVSVFAKIRKATMSSTFGRIVTGMFIGCLLLLIAIATGFVPHPRNWGWSPIAKAGVLGQPDMSYQITQTLVVSVPGSGSLTTTEPDAVVWYPYADQTQYIKVFKTTYEQDNFYPDAVKKLTDAQASGITEGQAGVWSYVYGKKDGKYLFHAYCVPVHASGQMNSKDDVIGTLQRTIISRHVVNPFVNAATTQPTGSWGRSSGSSGSSYERGWSGSWGS